MKISQRVLIIMFFCLILIDFVECRRQIRNLFIRRRSSTRRTSSSIKMSGGSPPSYVIIILCVVVPTVFFATVCFIVRACRKRQQSKVAVEPVGLNQSNMNLNKEMQQAQANISYDPYFSNQQQIMYPIQAKQNNKQQVVMQQEQIKMVPNQCGQFLNLTYMSNQQQQFKHTQHKTSFI